MSNMTAGATGARRTFLQAAAGATLVAAIAVLSGCAAPVPNVSTTSTMDAGQGVAALRVISLHPHPLKQLLVTNLDTREEIRLVPQRSLGGDSGRFMAVLKAGRYQLKELQAEGPAGYSLVETITAPLARPSTQFDVEAGALTNLGSLVFAPTGEKRFIAPREDTRVAAREWLDAVNPQVAAKLMPGKELGWKQEPSAEERAVLLQLGAQARSFTDLRKLDVGVGNAGPWVGGRLGVVHDTARGAVYRTGTIQPITTATALQDGRLLAAGEEGYVAVPSPDRRTWKEIPAPVSRASAAVFVVQAPGGLVYLVSRTPAGVSVFEAAASDFAWREIRQEKLALPGVWGGGAMAVATGDRLVVYTADPEQLHTFDFRTRQWEARAPRVTLHTLRATADGMLYGHRHGATFVASRDYGASWQPIERHAASIFPVFVSKDLGYVMAKPFSLGLPPPYQLFKTTDGGRSWAAVGTAPGAQQLVAQGRMAWDPQTRSVGVEWKDGQHYWSQDEGKSWR